MRKILVLAIVATFATAGVASVGVFVLGWGDGGEQDALVAGVVPPAGKQWTEVVTETEEGYRMGNPDAPLKLVEYGSRTCPVCGAFGREGQRPLEENYVKTGKVSYEFREFLVHGAPDVPASVLGRCVGAEAFFPMLEQMYVNQMAYLEPLQAADADQAFRASIQSQPPAVATTLWAEKMGLIEFFKQRGLPEDKARACLSDTKELEKIAKITQDGADVVTGTPTFILNDKRLDNVIAWQDSANGPGLETALKNAGAR